MLSFWLAFLYADRPYYDKDRILCMANYLFEVQERNRLSQRGLLKRFSLDCMGHQETIEEMRAAKSEKFSELKSKRGSPEFEEWFLRYRPTDQKSKKEEMKELKEMKEMKEMDKIDVPKPKTKKRKNRKSKTKKLGFFF